MALATQALSALRVPQEQTHQMLLTAVVTFAQLVTSAQRTLSLRNPVLQEPIKTILARAPARPVKPASTVLASP
jgi:hypothetical protein